MAGVFTTIRESTYTQLGKMVTTGSITESQLRNYYKSEVKKARSRISKLRSESVTTEYGKQELPRFMKEKNLTTLSALVHEIADLNRFLNKKTSLVSGLKEAKKKHLERLKNLNMKVDEGNYNKWQEFIKWFNLSEYSKKFEYEDEVIEEIFYEAVENEKSTPDEWERLFDEYIKDEDKKSKRRAYK